MTDIFRPWPKIPREKGNMITITEKIDGTNACIIIEQDKIIGIQSRNRLIDPTNDNMGFANWVTQNETELLGLGGGYHYGEWAGPGVQKNPHNLEQKTFFLFNTFRPAETLPAIVSQVPILYSGPDLPQARDEAMENLWVSAQERGYKPEGIIIYIHSTRSYVKRTFENAEGKWVEG